VWENAEQMIGFERGETLEAGLPQRLRSRRHRILTMSLTLPAILLSAALLRRAWLDIDTGWDSIAYHLPFAALRTGILSPSQYHVEPGIDSYYVSFPVLPDYLQGWLWRLTSHAAATNLVALLALSVLVAFLWRVFRIPLPDSVLSLLAIPVVLIDSTSSYIDLFTNCALTVLLLLVFLALVFPARFKARHFIGALVAMAVASNSKTPFVVLATAGVMTLVCTMYVNRNRLTHLRWEFRNASRSLRITYVASILFLLGLSYYKYLENFKEFGNPVYPVALNVGPIKLPGFLDSGGTTPVYLRGAPKMAVWALSVIEYNAFDGRVPLWTNGQGDLKLSSSAFRMGGYFGEYVLLNVFWLLFLQFRIRRALGWKPFVFIAVLTVITSLLPASHELRYYSYWMLCLVAINLILIVNGLEGEERFTIRLFFLAGAVAALSFCILSDGGTYIRRTGAEPDRLVQAMGITKALSDMNLHQGEVVCVSGKGQFAFLYSPIFNPNLASKTHYGVLQEERPEGCGNLRIAP
jgi:hypothetical protein